MKTLELTDEQYKVIKSIVNQRKVMDRRCTNLPFYTAQTRVEEFRGVESGYSDHCGIHDSESKCLIENLEDFLDTIGRESDEMEKFNDNYLIMLQGLDYNDLDEVCSLLNTDPDTGEYSGEEYEVYYFDYRYEDRAWFLTEKEALDYCKYQSHNLCHPRTYCYTTGYANCGTFPKLLEMFDTLKLED